MGQNLVLQISLPASSLTSMQATSSSLQGVGQMRSLYAWVFPIKCT